jgi:hypothetical protein
VDGESGQTYSFENIGTQYWSNFANEPFANAAVGYNFRTAVGISTGEQNLLAKTANLNSWAVRDGDVKSTLSSPDNAVSLPGPSTIGIFLSGLLGIVAARRHVKAN